MIPLIRKIILKRFRSIVAEEIVLDNPTFFIGRNGSGKSNIVDAFLFLSQAMTQPLQAVFDLRGGIGAVRNRTVTRSYPPNVGMCVELGSLNGTINSASYAFEVKATKGGGYTIVRERCDVTTIDGLIFFDRSAKKITSNLANLHPLIEPNALLLPLIGGESRFTPVVKALASMRVYSIQPAKLRELQDPDSGESLQQDGSNASSVLQQIERRSPEDLELIQDYLKAIVPNTVAVRPKKLGQKLTLEFAQRWPNSDDDTKSLRLDAFNMSDGTLRVLGILLAIFQSPTPSLMVIEEPESTMHPGALAAIMELIRHGSLFSQIVVTTHSPELLESTWLKGNHLRIVEWHRGATRVQPVSQGLFELIGEQSPGELLRSNALTADSHALNTVPKLELFPRS